MGLKVMMFFVCLSNDKDRLVGSDSAREYSKILKYINNKWITT